MASTLFVCYSHGCKGERLSVELSQHPNFETLRGDRSSGRTVIVNDHFNKAFLHSWMPNFKHLDLPGKNIVVPSHWFYDTLVAHYPNECYVSIDLPKDIDQFHEDLYNRFYMYRPKSVAELAGECENILRAIRPTVDTHEVRKFAAEVMGVKDVTFGDIKCMASGIPATEENRRRLCRGHLPPVLSDLTRRNSLVIPYEDVDIVDVGYVVSYFNKCNGSL